MSAPKSLPARPSLDSLRKQAKKLARDAAARNVAAVARMRAQLSLTEPSISQRSAQLVVAREYGFAGWQDLKEEVLKRTGNGLAWAAVQAQRAIHENDSAQLKQLLDDYPALLAWRDELGRGLLHTATAFALDVADPSRETQFYRPNCAELLIDAGVTVEPAWWQGVIETGGTGMLQVLQNKGLLPDTLPVLAALGSFDSLHACFDEGGTLRASAKPADLDALTVVNTAFMNACRFKHKSAASFLLDRCIALDSDLGWQIDRWRNRTAFIEYLCEHYVSLPPNTPWRGFVVRQLFGIIDEDNLAALSHWLQSQPWLLEESCVALYVQLLEHAALKGREALIAELVGRYSAKPHRRPPQSNAILFALEYGHSRIVPLLARIWPVPDDLPHTAALGRLDDVKRWFDESGEPRLGNLHDHYPANNPQVRSNLRWGVANVQQVLDVALAWACTNRRFEIASFLLERGANINTRWGTHEPASILHECALLGNAEAVNFLVEHGIDLGIRDYRWNATAAGWAYHAARNPEMARSLAEAERKRMGDSQ